MAPQALRVAPGERFEVRLMAAAERPLSHLPLTIEYDPALLAVEAVEGGDFLGSADQVQLLTDSTRPGRLVIGASRLGEVPGVTGDGTVARLTLRALAAGDAALSFRDSQALDPALEALSPFHAAGARVTVAPGSEAPERLRPRPRTPRAEAGDRGAPRS
jgi:hypothetical protein